ncbi:MAG: AAA family ATPase [Candidatus Xenobia bacterium]
MSDRHSQLPRALQEALHMLDVARAQDDVTLLIGAPGSGKTSVLAQYAASHEANDIVGPVMLYDAEAVNTPLSLLRELLLTQDVIYHGATRDGLLLLLHKLRGRPFLLIDDAHRMASHSLEMLRILVERGGVRVVLAGPRRLVSKLRERCPELLHRVSRRHLMGEVQPADVKAVLRHCQPRRSCTPAAARRLCARSDGNLYRTALLLDRAAQQARRSHRALSVDLLEETANRVPICEDFNKR